MLGGTRRGELLQRHVVPGTMPILDEPHAAGPSFAEEALRPVTVAGISFRRHRPIVPDLGVESPQKCLADETSSVFREPLTLNS